MNNDTSSVNSHESSMPRLVEAARRHWKARRQPSFAQRNLSSDASRAFTVALSREVGTQGTSVAQLVGRLLGWHVYDHELVAHIAKEMGLRTALLESVDEKRQSWMPETIGASLVTGDRAPWASESSYVHHLVETVLALGLHGECVIVGRGAALILPAASTLRVRLVGPVKERIATLSRKLGISETEAARQVRTIDRERTDFVQDHFNKDPIDPRNYDLVLNTSRLPTVQSAEVIVETLHRLQAAGKDKTTVRPPS